MISSHDLQILSSTSLFAGFSEDALRALCAALRPSVAELPRGRVYVVQGEREILIPAVPEFVRGVDAEAGVITVHLIEGL